MFGRGRQDKKARVGILVWLPGLPGEFYRGMWSADGGKEKCRCCGVSAHARRSSDGGGGGCNMGDCLEARDFAQLCGGCMVCLLDR